MYRYIYLLSLKSSSAGNRTWIYCLEGNNANLYNTKAFFLPNRYFEQWQPYLWPIQYSNEFCIVTLICCHLKVRQAGIEPGSIAWKVTMLTITTPTHFFFQNRYFEQWQPYLSPIQYSNEICIVTLICCHLKVHQPGIELGSIAWKATMLTFTPPTHFFIQIGILSIDNHIFDQFNTAMKFVSLHWFVVT